MGPHTTRDRGARVSYGWPSPAALLQMPTPRAQCDAGSMTVTSFGDLPLADRDLELDSAAVAVMQWSRGAVELPSRDVDRVKSHLAKYYPKMDETPPRERD